LFLLAVSDYKRLDASFYFIITNFHTKLKTLGKGQPWYELSSIYAIQNVWLMDNWQTILLW